MGIREVAKLAGVSVSTVSRTLNETTYVKDETRLRVLDAAHRLNYSPNAFAKGLKSNKSNTIALVIPDISNMIFPKITQGVEKVMRKNGYITVLCNTGEDCGAEQDYIKFLTGISYTPDINQSAAVLRGVRAKGFETFTDTNELLGFLEEFWK